MLCHVNGVSELGTCEEGPRELPRKMRLSSFIVWKRLQNIIQAIRHHLQGIFSIRGRAKSLIIHATISPQKKRKLKASLALRIIISRDTPVIAWHAQ
jgi:hypothetical protein